MRREEFLNKLKNGLNKLDKNELNEIMYDYEEHFRAGAENGESEEEICKKLGNPETIAKTYYAEQVIMKVKEEKGIKNYLAAIFTVISLGFVNLIFILGPVIALFAILLALWATVAAITISGIAISIGTLLSLVIPGIITPPIVAFSSHFFFAFFCGLGIAALGFLLVIGMFFITKIVLKGFLKYIEFNVKIVKNN